MATNVIIAVLDTSGSMSESATQTKVNESSVNYTRIDLLKHSMKTVISMLCAYSNNHLGIIEFNSTATTKLTPIPMLLSTEDAANGVINSLSPGGGTNIWDGLREGLAQARIARSKLPEANIHIVLLTDGEPTPSFNPPQGIASTLALSYPDDHKLFVHSFGFGYSLDSKLLMDICVVGKGMYGYIPDYSMIGSIFINFCSSVLSSTKIALSPTDEAALERMKQVLEGVSADSVGTNPFTELRSWLKGYDTPLAQAMIDDIEHEDENKGQLMKALSSPTWFKKWGYNHILAYRRALETKACMNFKDQVLQLFKTEEFESIREKGNALFASLPAPVPSGYTSASFASLGFSMSTFNTADGGCFHGDCYVKMIHGIGKQVKDCKKGDVLENGATILCVVKRTFNKVMKMVRFTHYDEDRYDETSLLLTPWHPVCIEATDGWVFPCLFTGEVELVNVDVLYDFVLDTKHSVRIGNYDVLTLGHGIENDPVASHPYYGTNAIVDELKQKAGWEEGLVEL